MSDFFLSVQFANADILVCLQLWDFLKLANGGDNLQSQCPKFCDLMEKTLGIELSVSNSNTAKGQAAPSVNSWKAIGVAD